MAKAVFRPGEVQVISKPIILDSPQGHAAPGQKGRQGEEQIEEVESLEETYTGPTADDLRREAEAFKVQWEQEREAMINAARAEAEAIIKDAEAAAFQEVKRKTDQAQQIKRQA
ncbi:MAG: flagellar assembly protein FliH, partial [Termitinemataceae bacterium]